ncbi:hypothetical protein NM688_g4733 [Phlebia brevispora]|uniref:Uncharacterized protein n=1 Tax=Phlebia brevispora TaxID=194682 RepID=A0ACC1T246_9APHY|nr:hypothetical protein NM688_g4733 [Phlebia brevispora]
MDEKGIMLGLGKRRRAFVDRDQKTLYSIEDGNRELVTVIECVAADGGVLPLSVIYQGKCRDLEWGRNNPCNASISHSPNGWTDQELGAEWLEKDFEPQSAARNKTGSIRLLILDGHNSHCTYRFCHFAEQHDIIIVCLPAHTTHALQLCDVGVFGPLESCWRHEVNQAGRNFIPINKTNLLIYYSAARERAFKESTIKAAFQKTGIHPFNPDAIDPALFEPALNTTTTSAQPMPAKLSELLVPISNAPHTPSQHCTALSTIPEGIPTMEVQPGEHIPSHSSTSQYHIPVPPTPPHWASRNTLRDDNKGLRTLLKAATAQMTKDYAQMQLMDLENGQLRQRAFGQEKRKSKKTSTHARHMTGEETLMELARAD